MSSSLPRVLAEGLAQCSTPIRRFEDAEAAICVDWVTFPKDPSVPSNFLATLDEHARFHHVPLLAPETGHALLLRVRAPELGRDAERELFVGWVEAERVATLERWIVVLGAYLEARRRMPIPTDVYLVPRDFELVKPMWTDGDGHSQTPSHYDYRGPGGLVWSPDGRFVLRRCKQSVLVHDADAPERACPLWGQDPIHDLAFSPDSRWLATASGDYDDGGSGTLYLARGLLTVWRLEDGAKLFERELTDDEPRRIAFDETGTALWYALEYKESAPARRWDFTNGAESGGGPVLPPPAPLRPPVAGEDVPSPDGARTARLVPGANDGWLVLSVTGPGGERRAVSPLGPIRSLSFTSDRELVVGGAYASETWYAASDGWAAGPPRREPTAVDAKPAPAPPRSSRDGLTHASTMVTTFPASVLRGPHLRRLYVVDNVQEKRANSVKGVTLSAAGDRLALVGSGSAWGSALTIDLGPALEPGRVLCGGWGAEVVALSPDGWTLACGNDYGQVWLVSLGEPLVIARDRARQGLEAMRREAERDAADPYWGRGTRSVKRWTEAAYRAALAALHDTAALPNEEPAAHMARVAAAIRALRDREPDDDNDGWWTSAIDDALTIVGSASL